MEIYNYADFTAELLKTGFSMGGGNDNGMFSLISWDWKQEPPYETPVRWHTGNPETDPWEWRTRVLDERNDIAYAKLFFKKSGYITKDWYPYFLKVRRDGMSFEEKYADGTTSNFAKRIYEVIDKNAALPIHTLKQLAGFSGEDKSKFDRAPLNYKQACSSLCADDSKNVLSLVRNMAGHPPSFAQPRCFLVKRCFGKQRELICRKQ